MVSFDAGPPGEKPITIRDAERLNPRLIWHESGCAFVVDLGDRHPPGDSPESPTCSELVLFENEKPLTPHSAHEDIRRRGQGRFSHWGRTLYFSSTDNTDPRTNQRAYRIELQRGELDCSTNYISPPADHRKAAWTCRQAWQNFFVNQKGQVRVCCNNDTLIGNLNESTFDKIWASYTLAHVRSLQLAGDYVSSSCQASCHELINRFPANYSKYGSSFPGYNGDARSGDPWLDSLPQSPFRMPRTPLENRLILAREFDLEVCRTVSMPTRGLIVPIAKCNLYCPFCDTGVLGERTPNDLISDEALERLRPVYPHLQYLEIVGAGEIFYYSPKKSPMKKILDDLCAHASPDLELLLLTNGVALKKPWVDEIIRTDVATIMAVSIDTVDPETYKMLRVGGSIDNLKRNLEYLEAEKARFGRTRPRWRFNIVLSTLTARHLPETIAFVKQYDPEVFFLPLVDGGDRRFTQEHDLFRTDRRGELLHLRSVLGETEIPSNKDEIIERIEYALA
jgi:MoaA/NifB/PqqE/SkfB family radical SAM enzyme